VVAGVISAVIVLAAGVWLGVVVGGPAGVAIVAAALVLDIGLGRALAEVASYDLGTARGAALFAVDHTWSLVNTVAGAIFLLVNLARRNGLDPDSSRGTRSIVFTRGVFPGYATTIGNVIAGVKATSVSLRRHEEVHVLQARLFGPFYIPLVGVGYLVAILLPYWLLYHDRAARPIRSVRDYFMRGVYPHTWHEEWAYSVGGRRR
jgi:hypothetical protein